MKNNNSYSPFVKDQIRMIICDNMSSMILIKNKIFFTDIVDY